MNEHQQQTIQGILKEALDKVHSQYNVRVTFMRVEWQDARTLGTDGQYRPLKVSYEAEANFR